MFHYLGLLEFASSLPLGREPDANSGGLCTLIHILACRIPCKLFIHKLLFVEPFGLNLPVSSELGRSLPFRPMRALALPWSWAFNLVCKFSLRFAPLRTTSTSHPFELVSKKYNYVQLFHQERLPAVCKRSQFYLRIRYLVFFQNITILVNLRLSLVSN